MSYETAKIITDEGLEGLGRYYSVYRGIVIDNEAPYTKYLISLKDASYNMNGDGTKNRVNSLSL